MAIIEDYGAIAKRLRELQPNSSQQGKEIDQEAWRNLAEKTAREWVQNRRKTDLLRGVIGSRKIRGTLRQR
jgi:hypothetical protein